jgi:hypothetical protein
MSAKDRTNALGLHPHTPEFFSEDLEVALMKTNFIEGHIKIA